MKKVLFSATLAQGHISKFHIPYLRWFKEQGWETWVAARNDYDGGRCSIPFCDHFVDIPFERSPFSRNNMRAYQKLRKVIDRERFDIIHTHTPVGGVLTRFAARRARMEGTKVIYTAHGFHFYAGAPLANWLLWYPVEKYMSRFADVLVTINKEDYQRAKNFAFCSVKYIPGVGVDLSRFSPVCTLNCEKTIRDKLTIAPGDFVLLSVGDLTPKKNQSAIVEALSMLPENVVLLICGVGPEEENLRKLARDCGVANRVSLLGFRDDIADIMSVSNTLVFPSMHEGLPVAVMEAMASGLPIVASSIRGINPDLLIDHESALLLNPATPQNIATSVTELIRDAELCEKITANAAESVRRFSVEETLLASARLYNEVLSAGA